MYASLRRVGGSLCGWNVKKAPTQAPTQVFDRTWRSKPLAGQPLQTCLRLHCTAKHTWSAYATYHTVHFVLDFMMSKKRCSTEHSHIASRSICVSICMYHGKSSATTHTCTLQISQSHMSNSTTSMRHTQSLVRVQTHDTVTSKLNQPCAHILHVYQWERERSMDINTYIDR